MQDQNHFYYTKVMVDLFSKQPEIKNHEEFWEFMEGQMLDGLYWEYYYNDGEKPFICPGGEEMTGPCPISPSDRNVLYENRMLGLPRIRQLRVKNDSCEVHPHFQRVINNCYSEYSEEMEDREPFGNNVRIRAGPRAWKYSVSISLLFIVKYEIFITFRLQKSLVLQLGQLVELSLEDLACSSKVTVEEEPFRTSTPGRMKHLHSFMN